MLVRWFQGLMARQESYLDLDIGAGACTASDLCFHKQSGEQNQQFSQGFARLAPLPLANKQNTIEAVSK